MEQWQDLTGKVVMVTGASSGIGREFSLNLAKAGCKIIAAARRVDKLKSLCDEISHQFGSSSQECRAIAIMLDITADSAIIKAAVQRAWDAFGRIDALINNAGLRGSVQSSLELSEENWNYMFKVNLRGAWLVSKYVCMHMRDSKQGGSVINISSVLGLNRGILPGGIAYASSKYALDMLTKDTMSQKDNYRFCLIIDIPAEIRTWYRNVGEAGQLELSKTLGHLPSLMDVEPNRLIIEAATCFWVTNRNVFRFGDFKMTPLLGEIRGFLLKSGFEARGT